VAEFLKCRCAHCGAKYRLPLEAQGRTARCKKCGKKFAVPKAKDRTLEDSVLDWLSEAEEEQEVAAQPRVINIPKDSAVDEKGQPLSAKRRGPIRMKSSSMPAEGERSAG